VINVNDEELRLAKNRVIIELSPTNLRVCVVRGRTVVGVQTSRLTPVMRQDHGEIDFAAARQHLEGMVASLALQGLDATVLYSSGTAIAGVFSCAAGAGSDAVGEAARLALADSAEFNIELNPFDLIRLCADQPLKATAEHPPQVHTLGIADTESTVGEIFAWVARAGLVPTAVVPVNAVGLAQCVGSAIASSRVSPSAVCVALHLGEHQSVLVGATQGRMRFVRQVSIGIEALVDAIASAQLQGGGTLDRAQAAEVLHVHGIPARSQQLSADGTLTGAVVLPLIQPVLQRLVVEIKQSLRFGVEAPEREHTHLCVHGPGSAVANLSVLIAEQTGFSYVPEADDSDQGADSGTAQSWIATQVNGLGMLPSQVTAKVAAIQLRHALWVGAGVTALLIGLDAWSTTLDLDQRRAEVSQLKERLAAAQPATVLRQRLDAIETAVSRASAAVDLRMRSVPDGTGVFAMLAAHTPESVKLMHVQIQSEDGVPVAHVNGRAMGAGGVDPDSILRAYVESLSGVALVQDCRIGGTRRGAATDGSVMQTFDLVLKLVDVPVTYRSAIADDAKEAIK